MKKLTAITLFIFWAIITAILTAGLAFYQNGKLGVQTQSVPLVMQGKPLTMQELAKHNSETSCWLLIDGKIYDVTSYLYQHPGNADTILPTCGTDATAAYNTKGDPNRPRPHSDNARQLLANYYIGDLGQTQVQSQQQTATTPPAQPGTTRPTTATPGTITLSAQQIATHNTAANCWMIVNNNVYNVTSYLNQHPGGRSAILGYCGKDGSAAFEGLPHSTNAHQLLANFYVGAVGGTTSSATIQKTVNPPITSGAGQREVEND